jgi:hypothetical protein
VQPHAGSLIIGGKEREAASGMLSNFTYNQSLSKAINAYKSQDRRFEGVGGIKGKNSSPGPVVNQA